VREAYDLLQTVTEADWSTSVARMARVPECLASLDAAFTEGRHRDVVAARRQVAGAIAQVEVWAGVDPASTQPYFHELADRLAASGIRSDGLRADCEAAATRATAALASFVRYLTSEYGPDATVLDPPEVREAVVRRLEQIPLT
jgi:uncharacterized protein (DUF885 family)